MKLYLYQCLCENNRLDKRGYLTQLFELDGTLREECSLITPVIQVQLIELAKIVKANYAYIPDFGRYYYIDDIVGERTGIITLYMRSDPLMSFREGILDLNVFCSRNEYDFSTDLIDNLLPSKVDYDIDIQSFAADLPSSSYNYGLYYVIVYATKQYLGRENGRTVTNSNRVLIVNRKTLDAFISFFWGESSSTPIWGDDKSMYKNEPWEAIQGIYSCPFDLSNIIDEYLQEYPYASDSVTVYKPVTFGSTELGFTLNSDQGYRIFEPKVGTNVNPVLAKIITYKLSTSNITKSSINYINYDPYTKTTLYIPYIGFDSIESSILLKYSELTIDLYTNLVSGKTEAILSGDGTKLKIYTTNMFADIPISGTNANQRKLALNVAGVRTAGRLFNFATDIIGSNLDTANDLKSLHQSNKYKKVTSGEKSSLTRFTKQVGEQSSGLSAVKGGVNFITDTTVDYMSAMVERISAGSHSLDNISWVVSGNPYLYITKVKPVIPNNYNKLLGRPSTYKGALSGLKGYTEIAGVHIEFNQLNSSPTSNEREEIDGDLRSGIILPDIYRSFSLTMKGATTDILYWNGKTYTKDVSESTKTFEMSIPIENFTEDIITRDRISSVTFNNCTGTYTDYSIHFNSANDNSSIEINFTIN